MSAQLLKVKSSKSLNMHFEIKMRKTDPQLWLKVSTTRISSVLPQVIFEPKFRSSIIFEDVKRLAAGR